MEGIGRAPPIVGSSRPTAGVVVAVGGGLLELAVASVGLLATSLFCGLLPTAPCLPLEGFAWSASVGGSLAFALPILVEVRPELHRAAGAAISTTSLLALLLGALAVLWYPGLFSAGFVDLYSAPFLAAVLGGVLIYLWHPRRYGVPPMIPG